MAPRPSKSSVTGAEHPRWTRGSTPRQAIRAALRCCPARSVALDQAREESRGEWSQRTSWPTSGVSQSRMPSHATSSAEFLQPAGGARTREGRPVSIRPGSKAHEAEIGESSRASDWLVPRGSASGRGPRPVRCGRRPTTRCPDPSGPTKWLGTSTPDSSAWMKNRMGVVPCGWIGMVSGSVTCASRVASMAAARPATVAFPLKKAVSGTSTPNSRSISTRSRMAIKEWPPTSKKSSCRCHPVHLEDARPNRRKPFLDGRMRCHPCRRYHCPVRRRQRVRIHLAVRSESRFSATKAAGTMYSGSVRRSNSPNCALVGGSPFGTTYANSRRSPGVSSRETTTVAAIPSWPSRAVSISPGSIR